MSDQGEVAPHTGAEGTARHSDAVDGPTGPMPQLGVEAADAPFQSRFSFSDELPKSGFPQFSMTDAEPAEAIGQGDGDAGGWFTPAATAVGPAAAPQAPGRGAAPEALGQPAAPQAAGPAAMPEYEAAMPEYQAAMPEYQAAMPDYEAPMPEHEAAVAGYDAPAFDGVDSGEGQTNYAGVDMSGPAGPVKAGVPSSGNWQMPEWMRAEAGDAPGGGFNLPEAETGGGGKGKVVLFVVIGLILVAALAAAAVYFLKPSGKSGAKASGTGGTSAQPSASGGAAAQPSASQPPLPQGMADTPLPKFPGTHTKALGRIDDAFAGLSYPKLGSPWQVPAKKSGMMQPGWSGQQIVVTEKHGNQIWYGQLMTGLLGPAEQDIYKGPGTEHAATVAYEQGLEARLYGFPHESKPIASQALDLPGQGGKGWLVSSELSYHRDGIKATGEIVTVAIVDTGKKAPAVLFMSVPNTEKKLLPDINFVVESLKIVH